MVNYLEKFLQYIGIHQLSNGNHIQDKGQEEYQIIKVYLISFQLFQKFKYLYDENREFYFWSEQIPSNIIDSDSSLKSLEFLLYAHFAIYYLRSNISNIVSFLFDVFQLVKKSSIKNEKVTRENMEVFKTYTESIKVQAIS